MKLEKISSIEVSLLDAWWVVHCRRWEVPGWKELRKRWMIESQQELEWSEMHACWRKARKKERKNQERSQKEVDD